MPTNQFRNSPNSLLPIKSANFIPIPAALSEHPKEELKILNTPISIYEKAIDKAQEFVGSKKCGEESKHIIELLSGILANTLSFIKATAAPPDYDYHHKHSVVFSGLAESSLASSTDRIKEDTNCVIDILEACDIEALPITVYRMGKKSDTRSRLLKVELPTRGLVGKLLTAQRQLASTKSYTKVRIRPSLTYAERVLHKHLIEECTEKRKNTGQDFVIYAGNVMLKSDIAEWKKKNKPTST